MACCDDDDVRRDVDMRDLPDVTFCCMGRMAFLLSTKAATILTGAPPAKWNDMDEAQRLKYGAKAKAAVLGEEHGDEPFDVLFEEILMTMTTAA